MWKYAKLVVKGWLFTSFSSFLWFSLVIIVVGFMLIPYWVKPFIWSAIAVLNIANRSAETIQWSFGGDLNMKNIGKHVLKELLEIVNEVDAERNADDGWSAANDGSDEP